MKILFVGDIVGSPGRKALKENLQKLKREHEIDVCIANGENSAAGTGITYVIAKELLEMGVDCITLGNHTWAKREILHFIESEERVIRPANYAPGVPGKGYYLINTPKGTVGVINLMGRVYMDSLDCPFRMVDRVIEEIRSQTQIIIVDFHAEATSEKCAFAYYVDGRVSAVLGTHTHVQTADERILPCGTGFITDVGMTGPSDSIIGVQKETVINKFLNGMPARFEVANGITQINAVILDIEEKKGRTIQVKRIFQQYTLGQKS